MYCVRPATPMSIITWVFPLLHSTLRTVCYNAPVQLTMMILKALANFTIMLSADVQLHWFWKTQNLRNTHRWVYCEPTETALMSPLLTPLRN